MILRVAAPRLGANLPTLHMASISPVIRSPARMASICFFNIFAFELVNHNERADCHYAILAWESGFNIDILFISV